MVTMETTLTDQEIISEVRDALAQIGSQKIPDDTITQTADRFVIPLLNNLIGEQKDQENFDNAVIAWTAEMSFSAWLNFTRLSDRELEAFIDGEEYLSQLEKRTDLALRVIGVTRPPQTPNEVVTIRHGGKKRKVNLQKPWLPED